MEAMGTTQKKGFDLAPGFVWLVGNTMENHGKPMKTSICNGWEKHLTHFWLAKWDCLIYGDHASIQISRRKTWVDKRLPKFQGLAIFWVLALYYLCWGRGMMEAERVSFHCYSDGLVACDCTQLLSKNQFQVVVYPQWPNLIGVFRHQRPFFWWIPGVSSMFVAIFPC